MPLYFIPRVLKLTKVKLYVRNGYDGDSETVNVLVRHTAILLLLLLVVVVVVIVEVFRTHVARHTLRDARQRLSVYDLSNQRDTYRMG